MIVQKEFLSKLKDFGLNSYESKLWTALLSRGVSTAGELSDIANVPRSRSYDVLESLEKKGFIIMKLGKPIKYIAVPPEEVIERVKKQIESDADKQYKIIDSLKNSKVLEELNQLHSQGIEMVDPSELTGAVKGRNNIYNHLNAMIKDAKESVVLMTTEDGLLRKSDHLYAALKKCKDRNVDVHITSPNTAKSKPAFEKLSKVAKVKHVDKINARFCIVDGKQVLFMLLNDKETHPSYDVGIWVNSPFFSKALHDIYHSMKK